MEEKVYMELTNIDEINDNLKTVEGIEKLIYDLENERTELSKVINRNYLDDEYLSETRERGSKAKLRNEYCMAGEYHYGIIYVRDIEAHKWLNTAIQALKEILKCSQKKT